MDRSKPHPFVGRLKEYFVAGRIGRREFLREATLLGLSAGAAYAFVGKVAGGPVVAPARAADMPRGGSVRVALRIGVVKHPFTYSWWEPEIARQVLPHLTKTGPDNVTRPHLLESWEASEDLRTWTLHLRKDVTWRKGGPLVADQVVWNLRQVLDENVGSPALGLMSSYMLKEVDKGKKDDAGNAVMSMELWDANAVEKVDDHTIRINTKLPQVAVPQHLQHGTLGIQDPAENGEFGVGSNGTGAFELVEFEAGRKAVLKAVPGYWEAVGPWLDGYELIDTGDDPAAALAALAAKQVDGIFRTDIVQLDAVRRLPHVQIYEAASSGTSVARMKVTEKPFDDPRVRKAMRLAIDPRAILKLAHRDLGLPGEHHHVCPVHPDYAELPFMERNLDAARRLLADAGHADGIEIEMTCKPDPAWELLAVQAMVEQWREAGIKVAIKVVPAELYWEVWTQVPLGFTEWAHDSLGIINLSQGYRTGVPWNESSYSNPEFDRLMTEAEGILDVIERKQVLAQIETLMQEDGPIVQPVWLGLFTAYDKRVQGFQLYPTRYIHANELAIGA